MAGYTVRYMDSEQHLQDVGVYAENAYNASEWVIKEVPYIHDHPNSIKEIKQSKLTDREIWGIRSLVWMVILGSLVNLYTLA